MWNHSYNTSGSLLVCMSSAFSSRFELRAEKLISRPRDYSVLKTVARATISEFYIRKHGIRDILAIGGLFVPLLSRNRTF